MAAVQQARVLTTCSVAQSSAVSRCASVVRGTPLRSTVALPAAARTQAVTVAREAEWAPGSDAPAHLDGSMAGDFGFDPLYLGADPAKLKWYREAELQHARWAMLATSGIIAANVIRPDVFFYNAATEASLPFNIGGIIAFQFIAMHWAEIRRWRDTQSINSVNKDPIFNQEIPEHTDASYPGGIFDPLNFSKGDIEALKVKEIKNGRLAMLAFVGMIAEAQVTGENPLAALGEHIADPFNTTVFSAVLAGGGWFHFAGPGCAIPSSVVFEGITIPTPCLPIFGL